MVWWEHLHFAIRKNLDHWKCRYLIGQVTNILLNWVVLDSYRSLRIVGNGTITQNTWNVLLAFISNNILYLLRDMTNNHHIYIRYHCLASTLGRRFWNSSKIFCVRQPTNHGPQCSIDCLMLGLSECICQVMMTCAEANGPLCKIRFVQSL